MKNYFPIIKKLQNALNINGRKVTISSKQFYSDDQQSLVTIYTIGERILDPVSGKKRNLELYSSSSQVYILLYLRDMWYELNDYTVPEENDGYKASVNSYKKKMAKKEMI